MLKISRRNNNGRAYENSPGPRRFIHSPSRGSFKSTPVWLLASALYFLTGPILVLVTVEFRTL